MSGPDLLSPDLREAARQLIATGRIRAETNPDRYKAALAGRKELTDFFREELGWTVETLDVARLVRLHKRRSDRWGEWQEQDRGQPQPWNPLTAGKTPSITRRPSVKSQVAPARFCV